MSVRAIVTLGLALLFGISTAVLIRSAMTPKIEEAKVTVVEVVVAAQKIAIWQTFTKEMLTTQPTPKNSLPEGVILAAEMETLIGKKAKVNLEEGEQLYTTKVGDSSSLASEISAGKLAFSIGTQDPSSSNAGFLQHEDRVNVIFTPSGNKSGSSTVTLLSNMRIIAINNKDPRQSPDGDASFEQVQSVTLEVTEEQSKKLSYCKNLGTLNVALLSDAKTSAEVPPDVTMEELEHILDPAAKTSLSPTPSDASQGSGGVMLLVPSKNVAAGDQLSEDAVMPMAWTGDGPVLEGALRPDDLEDVLGKQPLVALVRGEPLFASRLSQRKGSAVPPSPDESGNPVGARMIVNEMRNRAFGQTELNVYRKN